MAKQKHPSPRIAPLRRIILLVCLAAAAIFAAGQIGQMLAARRGASAGGAWQPADSLRWNAVSQPSSSESSAKREISDILAGADPQNRARDRTPARRRPRRDRRAAGQSEEGGLPANSGSRAGAAGPVRMVGRHRPGRGILHPNPRRRGLSCRFAKRAGRGGADDGFFERARPGNRGFAKRPSRRDERSNDIDRRSGHGRMTFR